MITYMKVEVIRYIYHIFLSENYRRKIRCDLLPKMNRFIKHFKKYCLYHSIQLQTMHNIESKTIVNNDEINLTISIIHGTSLTLKYTYASRNSCICSFVSISMYIHLLAISVQTCDSNMIPNV